MLIDPPIGGGAEALHFASGSHRSSRSSVRDLADHVDGRAAAALPVDVALGADADQVVLPRLTSDCAPAFGASSICSDASRMSSIVSPSSARKISEASISTM